MSVNSPIPLGHIKATRFLAQFIRDPLKAVQRAHAREGPFFTLSYSLPFRKPLLLAVGIGAEFNRQVLSQPEIWRTVSIGPGGPSGSAARRLQNGIIRMRGPLHQHYRRLLLPPLQKSSVNALSADMAQLIEGEIASWPAGEPADLWFYVRRLMRTLAIGLLFGDDREHGYPVAEMINRTADLNWSVKVAACPFNIPGTAYHRLLTDGKMLEDKILEWADRKRGPVNSRDLLSIVVNNPDESGQPPSDERVVGHVPTLFGAAYETCQNTLLWTLVLLDQHPHIARDLSEELEGALGPGPVTLEKINALPLLDSVIRESMRILPPVPQQFRVALQDTDLGGIPVPKRTRVLLSPWLTNRDPDLYPDPSHFRPARWDNIHPSPYEYMAFSAGPRGCPGYWFGLSVVKASLAAILARFRPAVIPNTRIDYKVKVTLSPRQAVPALLHTPDKAFTAAPLRGTIHDLVHFG